jgi:CIC family chloride channel protein
MRRGIDIHRRGQADIMRTTTVSEVMTRDFPTVSPSMLVHELADMFEETGHHGFPVVDESGNLCGVVTLEDVEHAPTRDDPKLRVEDIAMKSPLTAYPDQTIYEALAKFGGQDVGRIPVVDRQDRKKLLGVLRRHDIIRAYTRVIKERGARDML